MTRGLRPAADAAVAGVYSPRPMAHGLPPASRPQSRAQAWRDPPIARWGLTALALGFLGVFLVVPFAAIFAQAFANGAKEYVSAILEPDAQSALRLHGLPADGFADASLARLSAATFNCSRRISSCR